jgi:hypothetical protein
MNGALGFGFGKQKKLQVSPLRYAPVEMTYLWVDC